MPMKDWNYAIYISHARCFLTVHSVEVQASFKAHIQPADKAFARMILFVVGAVPMESRRPNLAAINRNLNSS